MERTICQQERRAYLPERLLQPADVAPVVITCLSLPRTAEVIGIDIRAMLKS
jgi:NADP-dependent 3-hydroxy acid dehydrogenase YdfG